MSWDCQGAYEPVASQVRLDTCDVRRYSYLTLDLSRSWIILDLAIVYFDNLRIEVGQ